MTSDTYRPGTGGGSATDKANDDMARARSAVEREGESARNEAQKASQTVREEASHLAAQAKDRAYQSADRGKEFAAGNIEDFAAAVRKASDELGERDQSMAASMVREAANGLEQVSRSIKGQSMQDITRSVAGFARRQPTAFLVGAALAGVALGRFARASGEHDNRQRGYGYGDDEGYGSGRGYGSDRYDQDRYGSGRYGGGDRYGSAGRMGERDDGYSRTYVDQPIPTEGAHPTRDPLKTGATGTTTTGIGGASGASSVSATPSATSPLGGSSTGTTAGSSSSGGTSSTTPGGTYTGSGSTSGSSTLGGASGTTGASTTSSSDSTYDRNASTTSNPAGSKPTGGTDGR